MAQKPSLPKGTTAIGSAASEPPVISIVNKACAGHDAKSINVVTTFNQRVNITFILYSGLKIN